MPKNYFQSIIFVFFLTGFIFSAFNFSLHASDTGLVINAITKGDIETVKRLVPVEVPADATGGSFNESLLNHACLHGQTKIVQFLIENGAKINVVTGKFGGMTPLIRSCTNCSLDATKLLISRGADPNFLTKGIDGENQLSPLSHAVTKGCYEVSEFLIDQGADINFSKTAYNGKPGHTVLTTGIIDFADADIATMLINKGADVNKPGYGKYPIQYAIEKFPIISNYDNNPEQYNKWADSFVELIDLLLRKGAKKDVKTKDNQSLSDLVKNKFDIKYHSLKMETFYREKEKQIYELLDKIDYK